MGQRIGFWFRLPTEGVGTVKSSKQQRLDLDAKRKIRRKKAAEEEAQRQLARRLARQAREASLGLAVDRSKLAPDGSYSVPGFVSRGYYLDQPFRCQGCGKKEVWTAPQQKWWYEVAKGNVWTTARFCRACRRRERDRRSEARRVHLAGVALKQRRAGNETARMN